MSAILLFLFTNFFLGSCVHINFRDDNLNIISFLENSKNVTNEGLNEFNIELFKILKKHDRGNIVISPFSIHLALSMILLGSPTSSKAHKQLAQALYNG